MSERKIDLKTYLTIVFAFSINGIVSLLIALSMYQTWRMHMNWGAINYESSEKLLIGFLMMGGMSILCFVTVIFMTYMHRVPNTPQA
jgi:uncharacterized BrkB/YihY/UPF0761 family membrane protein